VSAANGLLWTVEPGALRRALALQRVFPGRPVGERVRRETHDLAFRVCFYRGCRETRFYGAVLHSDFGKTRECLRLAARRLPTVEHKHAVDPRVLRVQHRAQAT